MKQKKLTSISIFAPCFNEALNIPHLVESMSSILPKISDQYELILVDDGSTDNTKEVISSLKRKFKFLRSVTHEKNRGYGAALKSGFAAAKNDWVFFTDGDLQFDISQLQEFVHHTKKYDVVIGYRFNRADGFARNLNAKLFKTYINILYRLHVIDIDCAFKLFRRSVIQSLDLKSDGAFLSTELLYKLKKAKYRFKQLPVNHYPRKFGEPTGSKLKVIVKALADSLICYFDVKKQQVKNIVSLK